MNRFVVVVTALSMLLVLSCKGEKKPAGGLKGTSPDEPVKTATPSSPTARIPLRPGPRIEGSGFTIELPSAFRPPRRSKRSTPNPAAGGNIEQTIWVSSSPMRDQVMVNLNRYPPKVFKVQTAAHLLSAVGNDGLRRAGGKAVTAKNHRYAGLPARTVSFTIQQGRLRGFGRQMLIATRPKVIQILYISRSRGAVDSPRVKAMFDSLKIQAGPRTGTTAQH